MGELVSDSHVLKTKESTPFQMSRWVNWSRGAEILLQALEPCLTVAGNDLRYNELDYRTDRPTIRQPEESTDQQCGQQTQKSGVQAT